MRPDDGDERLQYCGEPVFRAALCILRGQVEPVVAVELAVPEHLFRPRPPHGVLAPVLWRGARRVQRIELDDGVFDGYPRVEFFLEGFGAYVDLFEPGPFFQREHPFVLRVFLVVHPEVGHVLHERHEQRRVHFVHVGRFHDGQARKLFLVPGSAQVDDLQQVAATFARECYQVALAECAPEFLEDADATVLELPVADERYAERVFDVFEVGRCRLPDFFVVYPEDSGEDIDQFGRGGTVQALFAQDKVALLQEFCYLVHGILLEHGLLVNGLLRFGRSKDTCNRERQDQERESDAQDFHLAAVAENAPPATRLGRPQ